MEFCTLIKCLIIYLLHLDKIYKSCPSHTTAMENNAKLINPREINGFSLRCQDSPLFGRGVYLYLYSTPSFLSIPLAANIPVNAAPTIPLDLPAPSPATNIFSMFVSKSGVVI